MLPGSIATSSYSRSRQSLGRLSWKEWASRSRLVKSSHPRCCNTIMSRPRPKTTNLTPSTLAFMSRSCSACIHHALTYCSCQCACVLTRRRRKRMLGQSTAKASVASCEVCRRGHAQLTRQWRNSKQFGLMRRELLSKCLCWCIRPGHGLSEELNAATSMRFKALVLYKIELGCVIKIVK